MSKYTQVLSKWVKKLDLEKIKILFVWAEFNPEIVEWLEEITKNKLIEKGVKWENISVLKAPWALEIPFLIKKNLEKYDLIFAFWAVIRGETYHFEIVANESARGIMDLNLEWKTPIINWILTLENASQAKERTTENFAISGLNVLASSKKLKNTEDVKGTVGVASFMPG